ncbi:ras-related protein Rab-13-like isoform X4 [Falco rusticolus]|uniref:ras-related protein Rab-13-like isoform X4 n=1 Tax=Falco rusticolus TaxID=120794 RepID=UPI0018865363|nr:ras-related protein Rab-13-like isoform X4 [Falco rusticolus]
MAGHGQGGAGRPALLVKIVMAGESCVGKTSIVRRYTEPGSPPAGDSTSSYLATIGIDFKVKPVTFNDTRVKLQIWDTAGQERFHTLSTGYFRGAQGFVLVYDITNLDSFQSITSWMKDIHELAWEHGIPFFETSAKDNVNIEDAFSVLTNEILEKLEKISVWSYRAHTAVTSFSMLLKQVVVQWSIEGKNTLTCAGH